VPLDRSVYDPFVAISQNAALVRQAIRGRAKPSSFGRFALVSLGLLYLVYSGLFLHSLLSLPFSIVALVFVLLDLVIGLLILSAYHRMRSRDTWDEYRRWS
jgi:protein-S-isoprenylcysteine O-methyltransferase Ste14